NQNGKLSLIHGSKMFLSDSTFNIIPKVGDFYFFPNYLMHTVYPFSNTSDERRSISFNAFIDESIYNIYQTKN
ncbi:2OG-Fe(II) oxygenase family protein, partial [Candidatus Pelagibacter sp.]|nr:2OG-Fe(II) oxygenase family protein [Candidatus Pelagibacter sp.]